MPTLSNDIPRQAFMVIAHNEWDTLACLLQCLDFEGNDVFLHIDKRVKQLPKLTDFRKGRLFVLEKRKAVSWGDFSQVETEYLLFKEAFEHGPYTMYHLLSGVDMPIKPMNEIRQFFEQHTMHNFVGIRNSELDLQELTERWSYHYLFMDHNKRSPKHFLPFIIFRHLVVNIEKTLHLRRNTDIKLVKSHNWVSLNQQGMEFIISKEREVARRFRRTLCPDEIFVATMLWNSPIRDTLYNTEDDRLGCMRYIDWLRGGPYIWLAEDFNELKASPYMFARKISSALARMF